jgi:hypothetical protein
MVDMVTPLEAFMEEFLTWGLLSSTAEVAGFQDYQHLN